MDRCSVCRHCAANDDTTQDEVRVCVLDLYAILGALWNIDLPTGDDVRIIRCPCSPDNTIVNGEVAVPQDQDRVMRSSSQADHCQCHDSEKDKHRYTFHVFYSLFA